MSSKQTGQTLRRLREAARLRVNDVGDAINRQGKTVNAWENGRGEPDIDTLITLSVLYGVKNVIAEIAADRYGDASPLRSYLSLDEERLLAAYRELDRFGKLACERVVENEGERVRLTFGEKSVPLNVPVSKHPFFPGNGVDEISLYESNDFVSVPDTPVNREADFAVRIDGKGFEPRFSDGDVLLVHRQDSLQIGDIGLAAIDGAVFIKGSGHNRLISVSPGIEDIPVDGSRSVRFVGRIIAKA
jgi:SOS-response transcriptional repressor LexA/DNA-binding XRE family transcriptional regulator